MAVSTLSKSFNQELATNGTVGAGAFLDAAQFDENIQNNPKLRQQVNRLRETVGIEETKNTLAESTKQADQIFTDFDDETTAKNYINTNFDTKQAPIVNAIITRKFDEKRSADKGADANTWRAIDLVYQGNPDELFKFIELGKTKQSRDAMLRYTVDRISGKKLASNPKLYATLLAKTPDQTKKMDLNIFRSNLSEDEFKNLTQLYDQNDSAPDAIKSPFVFAVENYPFVDRNVAGLGFTNDDGETIDLGRVQKSEFIINANKQLQRQQQQNPDQPLTSSEIDRTLKNVELSTQATTNGPGINDNTLNKILKSGKVIVNAVDDTQRSPDVFDDGPFSGDVAQPTLLGGADEDMLKDAFVITNEVQNLITKQKENLQIRVNNAKTDEERYQLLDEANGLEAKFGAVVSEFNKTFTAAGDFTPIVNEIDGIVPGSIDALNRGLNAQLSGEELVLPDATNNINNLGVDGLPEIHENFYFGTKSLLDVDDPLKNKSSIKNIIDNRIQQQKLFTISAGTRNKNAADVNSLTNKKLVFGGSLDGNIKFQGLDLGGSLEAGLGYDYNAKTVGVINTKTAEIVDKQGGVSSGEEYEKILKKQHTLARRSGRPFSVNRDIPFEGDIAVGEIPLDGNKNGEYRIDKKDIPEARYNKRKQQLKEMNLPQTAWFVERLDASDLIDPFNGKEKFKKIGKERVRHLDLDKRVRDINRASVIKPSLERTIRIQDEHAVRDKQYIYLNPKRSE